MKVRVIKTSNYIWCVAIKWPGAAKVVFLGFCMERHHRQNSTLKRMYQIIFSHFFKIRFIHLKLHLFISNYIRSIKIRFIHLKLGSFI